MSTYATTATIHGTPIVRPMPGRHGNVHEPDLVEVARNRLQTDAPDVVRVTVVTSTDVEAAAYLSRPAAEALADAILTAADLNPDQPQEPPTLAGGIGADTIRGGARTQERALRVLERAVADAVAAGCLRSEVLLRVANGVTGDVNGPREYLIGRRMAAAVEGLPEVTQDQARSIAEYGFDTTTCEAAGRHIMREPSEVTTPGGGHDADRCPANPLVGDRLKVTR